MQKRIIPKMVVDVIGDGPTSNDTGGICFIILKLKFLIDIFKNWILTPKAFIKFLLYSFWKPNYNYAPTLILIFWFLLVKYM